MKEAPLLRPGSANRVFENHGDDSGDACSEGNLADQHSAADEFAPDHSPRPARSRPRVRNGGRDQNQGPDGALASASSIEAGSVPGTMKKPRTRRGSIVWLQLRRFGTVSANKLAQVRERRENVFAGCCRDDLALVPGGDHQPQIGEVEANEEFPLSLIVRPVDFPDQAFQR